MDLLVQIALKMPYVQVGHKFYLYKDIGEITMTLATYTNA
jgi:hypothetical protein